MEGNIKQNIFNTEEDLQKKLQIIVEKKRNFLDKKKKGEKEIEILLTKEEELKKKRRKFLQKKEALEGNIVVLKKKEAVARSEKREIEEKEKAEINSTKKREIEKKRWGIEEKKREIEKEKWRTEDKVKLLGESIREIEKEVTKNIRPQRKNISERIIKINDLLKRVAEKENSIKKEIIELKKVTEENRKKEIEEKKRFAEEERKKQGIEAKRKKEEDLKREMEEKEKKKEEEKKREEERIAEEERKKEEAETEETKKQQTAEEKKEKDAKDEEARKKIEEVFEVLEKNKEEINSLKEELQKKEKEQISAPNTLPRNFMDEKRVDFGEDKSQEKYKDLVEKEIKTQQQAEIDKKQVDFIRERVKEEQERWQKIQERARNEAINNQEVNYTIPKKEYRNNIDPQRDETFLQTPFQQQKTEGNIQERKNQKEQKIKMEQGEAEALFKKAEQSFYSGNFSTARSRFDRIVKNYTPSENNALFGAIKTKNLNEKANDYLQKINEKENKKNNRTSINDNILEEEKLNKERKKMEEELQELLAERRRIKESRKKMEEDGTNEEIIKEIDNEFNVLEKKRTELERKLGKIIVEIEDKKENIYAAPKIIVKEIIRERGDEKVKDEIKDEIQKEIEKIIKEKERLSKIEKLISKKKEDESLIQKEEIKTKEIEIKKEKKELEKKEKEAESEEEKEKIVQRKKEVEAELRRIVEEETKGKWEKRIREVEAEVAEVNKKYKELTEKEKHLKGKIKEMESWGPEGRKKKEDVYEYRSLYKTNSNQEEQAEEVKNVSDFEKRKKKLSAFYKINDFFRSIKPSKDFFLGPPLLVAIDISDHSIEVFCINEKAVTISFGRGILEEGIVYNGEIKDEEKLKKALLQTLSDAKPKPLKQEKKTRIKGIISLPESKVFSQQLKVVGQENVLGKVKEEIRNKIPIPIEDLYFYYQTISFTNKDEKIVLCITVEKKIIKKYINLLQSIDIDPIVFDIEGVSLGRAILSPITEKNKKEILSEMIVDIGARITTISIFCNGELSFSVGIPFGGAYFTENIAKTFNISKEEAEEKKKTLGVDGEIKSILSELLEKIIEEIRSAESYYERALGSKVKKIFLTGGAVIIPKILEHFKENLGEIVEIGNPLQRIKKVKELKKNEALIYSNAIGLALRTTEKDPIEGGFNLLPEEIKKQEKRYQRERKRVVRFGAVFIALIGVIVFFFSSYYAYKTFSFLSSVPSEEETSVVEENKNIDTSAVKEKEILKEEKTEGSEENVIQKETETKEEEENIIEENIVKGSTIVIPMSVPSEGISIYKLPEGKEIVANVYAGENYLVLQKVIDWILIETKEGKGWINKKSIDIKI